MPDVRSFTSTSFLSAVGYENHLASFLTQAESPHLLPLQSAYALACASFGATASDNNRMSDNTWLQVTKFSVQ